MMQRILQLPLNPETNSDAEPGTQHVIDFKDVNIKYGERTILKDLNFTVMNGEHWALSGENGAGNPHCSASCVQIILRHTPIISSFLGISVEWAKVSGTSRNTSDISLPKCTEPT